MVTTYWLKQNDQYIFADGSSGTPFIEKALLEQKKNLNFLSKSSK